MADCACKLAVVAIDKIIKGIRNCQHINTDVAFFVKFLETAQSVIENVKEEDIPGEDAPSAMSRIQAQLDDCLKEAEALIDKWKDKHVFVKFLKSGVVNVQCERIMNRLQAALSLLAGHAALEGAADGKEVKESVQAVQRQLDEMSQQVMEALSDVKRDKVALPKGILPIDVDQLRVGKVLSEEGSFGVVHEGLWNGPAGSMRVAVKVIKAAHMSDEQQKVLQREVQNMGRAVQISDQVCKIFGVAMSNNRVLIVMKRYATSLKKHLKREGRGLALPVWLGLAMDVTSGLVDLHAAGIKHFDLKPDNILIDSAGRGVISDFGLSRASEGTLGATFRNNAFGTLNYAPPEQMNRTEDGYQPDLGSDMWSLAATLSEAYSGQRPFDGYKEMQVLSAVCMVGETPQVPDTLPEAVRNVLTRCFLQNPDERPTAQEVLDVLQSMRGSGRRLLRAVPAMEMEEVDGELDIPEEGAAASMASGGATVETPKSPVTHKYTRKGRPSAGEDGQDGGSSNIGKVLQVAQVRNWAADMSRTTVDMGGGLLKLMPTFVDRPEKYVDGTKEIEVEVDVVKKVPKKVPGCFGSKTVMVDETFKEKQKRTVPNEKTRFLKWAVLPDRVFVPPRNGLTLRNGTVVGFKEVQGQDISVDPNGGCAIYVGRGQDLTIEAVTFKCFSQDYPALRVEDGGRVTLRDCTFQDCVIGAVATSVGSALACHATAFMECDQGLVVQEHAVAGLTACEVAGCRGVGVTVTSGGLVAMEDCEVVENATHGVSASGAETMVWMTGGKVEGHEGTAVLAASSAQLVGGAVAFSDNGMGADYHSDATIRIGGEAVEAVALRDAEEAVRGQRREMARRAHCCESVAGVQTLLDDATVEEIDMGGKTLAVDMADDTTLFTVTRPSVVLKNGKFEVRQKGRTGPPPPSSAAAVDPSDPLGIGANVQQHGSLPTSPAGHRGSQSALPAMGSLAPPTPIAANAPAPRWAVFNALPSARGLLLEDVVIAGSAGDCVRIDGAADVRLKGCTISHAKTAGVRALSGAQVDVEDCAVKDCWEAGVAARGAGTRVKMAGTVVEGAVKVGVAVCDRAEMEAVGGRVVKNGVGIAVGTNGGMTATNVHVLENRTAGVMAADVGKVTLSGCTCSGNVQGQGIVAEGKSTVLADGVSCSGNRIGVKAGGGSTVEVTKGEVLNNTSGMSCTGNGSTLRATGTAVRDNQENGVIVVDGATAELADVELRGHNVAGLYVADFGTSATLVDVRACKNMLNGVSVRKGAKAEIRGGEFNENGFRMAVDNDRADMGHGILCEGGASSLSAQNVKCTANADAGLAAANGAMAATRGGEFARNQFGVLALNKGSKVAVEDGVFRDNARAGAQVQRDGEMDLRRPEFINNKAKVDKPLFGFKLNIMDEVNAAVAGASGIASKIGHKINAVSQALKS
ncbi:unnamed protein product [Pedinophyceae sp. YPF-701]|nr:unnamed protein product [Pedinophyceae sp. YPF-701]